MRQAALINNVNNCKKINNLFENTSRHDHEFATLDNAFKNSSKDPSKTMRY